MFLKLSIEIDVTCITAKLRKISHLAKLRAPKVAKVPEAPKVADSGGGAGSAALTKVKVKIFFNGVKRVWDWGLCGKNARFVENFVCERFGGFGKRA
jgi:hypothetical protein